MKRKRIDWELIAFGALVAGGAYFLIVALIGMIKHIVG
jgi:hypothetical protein